MKTKKALVRHAAMIASLVMSVCILAGCSVGVFSSADIENPKKSIIGFIDAMQSENFDDTAAQTAMGYISNYSTMGFEKYTQILDDDFEKQLFDILRKSYKAEFSDSSFNPVNSSYQSSDISVSGKKAAVQFKFISADYTLMSVALSEAITETMTERAYNGEVYETEAEAMGLAREIFGTIFTSDTDMSEFCVERELTLNMEYIDGRWKIVVDDEFYDALLGK